MKIIDAHTHLGFSSNNDFSEISQLIKLMDRAGVEKAVVTLNTHTSKGLSELICKELKRGIKVDPYVKWNGYMVRSIKNSGYSKRLIPFLYLPPKADLAIASSKKYESLLGDMCFGYKVHPQELGLDLNGLIGFSSNRPLLIHSSVKDIATPEKIILLSKEYSGNVSVAHFAKCDITSLKKIKKSKNLFVDSSISVVFYNGLKKKSPRIYFSDYFYSTKSAEDLYDKVIALCGEEKLLFATDYPMCDTMGSEYVEEVKILKGLNRNFKEKIAYKNACRFLGIDYEK